MFRSECRGATIVEATFVVGLFIFLCLAILDFGRYMGVRSVMLRGAQEGLNFAQKVQGFDETTVASPAAEFNDKYGKILASVARRATRLPTQTLLEPSDEPSSASLVPARINFMTATGPASATYDVAVLRPGESARFIVEGTERWIDHPTLCSSASPTCTNPATGSGDMRALLKSHPIVVEMRAQYEPILPFIPPLTVVARAVGYRELGSVPSSVQPMPSFPQTPYIGQCEVYPQIDLLQQVCAERGRCFDQKKWIYGYIPATLSLPLSQRIKNIIDVRCCRDCSTATTSEDSGSGPVQWGG